MLAKFSYIFVALVLERTYMVSVAFHECCVTQSNVCFFCLWSRDLCLVYNVSDVAISLKWTGILFAAITNVIAFVFDGLLIWALLWLEIMILRYSYSYSSALQCSC